MTLHKDGSARRWRPNEKCPYHTIRLIPKTAPVCLTVEQDRAVFGFTDGRGLLAWDTGAGTEFRLFAAGEAVRSLDVREDQVMACSAGSVALYDVSRQTLHPVASPFRDQDHIDLRFVRQLPGILVVAGLDAAHVLHVMCRDVRRGSPLWRSIPRYFAIDGRQTWDEDGRCRLPREIRTIVDVTSTGRVVVVSQWGELAAVDPVSGWMDYDQSTGLTHMWLEYVARHDGLMGMAHHRTRQLEGRYIQLHTPRSWGPPDAGIEPMRDVAGWTVGRHVHIPDEILVLILDQVEPTGRASLALTCRKWYDVMRPRLQEVLVVHVCDDYFHGFKRFLRVAQDPERAARVRKLHVRPCPHGWDDSRRESFAAAEFIHNFSMLSELE